MPPRSRYREGEIVLCFQGCLIYEAKVLGVNKEESGCFMYDVHYKGWNKTWDEKVPEDRLLKLSSDNLAKQKAAEVDLKAKKSNAKKNGNGCLNNSMESTPQDGSETTPIELKDDPTPTFQNEVKISNSETSTDEVPIVPVKPNEIIEQPQPSSKAPKKILKKRKGSSKTLKRSRYESVEVRLEVIPKAKKIRSRSSSNASIISIHSGKSTDMSKVSKSRPIKPKIALKPENEVPQQKKKKAKKKSTLKESISASKKSNKLPSQVPLVQMRSRPFGSEINFVLPPELKVVLVDDLDYIGRQRKLLSIPSRFNVNDVVNSYYDDLDSTDADITTEEFKSTEEVCKGLRDYFNSTLGSLLLYKFERVQYSDTLKEYPGAVMSQLYGPVHLLRLLTKLGPLLASLHLEDLELDKIVRDINRFITFIASRRSEFFKIEDYGTATPEYHRRAL